MSTGINFAVVDGATDDMKKKVSQYITAGMDTTIDIAQDIVETEKDKSKQKELQNVMMQYIDMEHSLQQFLDAVEFVKKQVQTGEETGDLEGLLDKRLAELEKTSAKPKQQEHEKFREMLEKIQDSATSDSEMTVATVPATQIDEGLAMTQADVNVKCPYTGQTMRDPVKNKNCGHNYDREGIMGYIKQRRGRAKCPVGGCINDSVLEVTDLEENKELKRYIEKKNRQEGKRSKKGTLVVD